MDDAVARAPDEARQDHLGPELADVGDLPLARLLGAADTVLDNSLRRLLAAVDDREEPLAAFDSNI
jgi:FXSXX-COOH protein